MDQVRKIQSIGKTTKIVAKVMGIICLVVFGIVLITSCLMFFLPSDTISVSGRVESTVSIDEDSFNGLWPKIIHIDGFETDVNENGIHITFFDSGLSVNAEAENISFNIHTIAKTILCQSLDLLFLAIVFFFAYKFGKALQKSDGPFTTECTKSLKYLSFSMFALSLLDSILDTVTQLIFSRSLNFSTPFAFTMDNNFIIISIVIIIVSYIFEYGAEIYHKMQEENH